jgi:hypothetical protein
MRAIGTVNVQKANKALVSVCSKSLHKSMRATYYNLRLYYSNMRRNDLGMSKWDTVHGPEGFEKVI